MKLDNNLAGSTFEHFDIYPLSETAIIISFGTGIDVTIHNKVKAFTNHLDSKPIIGMVEYIPSFTSVTVFYDPIRVVQEGYKGRKLSAFETVSLKIKDLLKQLKEIDHTKQREVEIPVCYGGELGPDLEYVTQYNNLTTDEVIHIHSGGEYLVYMIGFAPGFPYLGGMSEKIATPRKAKPRMAIPKGSVGIAGKQTGVYSIETPGGWQLIGQTPFDLFLPSKTPPSLLQSGDIIRFKSISLKEYRDYKGDLR
ncbi:5-oxoprolinase subunit PxpB [Alkalihalobacillus sp. BA299]|uniref:5-oxoprolinase subunit PxpB n=1 Tax=Alkalihalobacillus sp. BA299 TaxID=2815938 RepID=UPI0027DCCAF5|nr:5-oxoprolinase subunit PxpB [Alkalihalobacillus sp. BA299]